MATSGETMASLVKVGRPSVASVHLSVKWPWLSRVWLPHWTSTRASMSMNTIELLLLIVHLELLVWIRREAPLAQGEWDVGALARLSFAAASSPRWVVLDWHNNWISGPEPVIDFLDVLERIRLGSVGSLDHVTGQWWQRILSSHVVLAASGSTPLVTRRAGTAVWTSVAMRDAQWLVVLFHNYYYWFINTFTALNRKIRRVYNGFCNSY